MDLILEIPEATQESAAEIQHGPAYALGQAVELINDAAHELRMPLDHREELPGMRAGV